MLLVQKFFGKECILFQAIFNRAFQSPVEDVADIAIKIILKMVAKPKSVKIIRFVITIDNAFEIFGEYCFLL
ncbi:MAG: hypothetical protein APR63_06560 [Desulfuromonas sp. SDB]|nr:MAG: hypothetical protein APR63_06560 [Desulfuromonas sp. SDB]